MNNIILKDEPIFPLFLLLHKTKKFENHNIFFSTIENILHLSRYKNLSIIIDREQSIVQAVRKTTLNHFFCTNHLKNDIKVWLNKNNFEKSVKSKVKILVRHLVNCKSIENLDSIWKNFIENENDIAENEKIMDYLKNNILPNIENNITNDSNGIFFEKLQTNNMSESYNYVIKQATDWKKNSIDKMCMIFYYLQTFNIREISRAMRGLGNYNPKDDLKRKFVLSEQEHVFDLEQIIQKLSQEYKSEALKISDNNSIEILAKHALEKNFISHNSNIGCFTVRDFTNPKKCYVTFLNPEPSCTCGSKIECFHIICARLSINENLEPKTKLNISAMTQKRQVKKTKENEIKFLEFKKSQDKTYKINLKKYLEETQKIKMKNPNQNINKTDSGDIMNNLFDWDVFNYDNYTILPPYEDLNPEKWLKDETVFKAIQSFIKYYETTEFVAVFDPDIIQMIIEQKFKNIYNYVAENQILNKQLVFINFYGDNIAFKIRAHFFIGIIIFKTKQIIIMDSLSTNRMKRDYVIAFRSILDILNISYSSFVNFKLFNSDQWELIISNDTGEQKDSTSCGLF